MYAAGSCKAVMSTCRCANLPCTRRNPATGGFTSEAVCKFIAGYGWVNGVAAACAANTYSTGGTNSSCLSCPTGLVTVGTGSTTVTACGKLSALLFAAAFFSVRPGRSAAECTPRHACCAAHNECLLLPVAAVLQPGKAAVVDSVTMTTAVSASAVTGVAPCPVGYVCNGGAPDGAGVPVKCPTGLTTDSTGSSTATACGKHSMPAFRFPAGAEQQCWQNSHAMRAACMSAWQWCRPAMLPQQALACSTPPSARRSSAASQGRSCAPSFSSAPGVAQSLPGRCHALKTPRSREAAVAPASTAAHVSAGSLCVHPAAPLVAPVLLQIVLPLLSDAFCCPQLQLPDGSLPTVLGSRQLSALTAPTRKTGRQQPRARAAPRCTRVHIGTWTFQC